MAYPKKYLGHRELIMKLWPGTKYECEVMFTTEDNEKVTYSYKAPFKRNDPSGLGELLEDIKNHISTWEVYYGGLYEPIVDVLERMRWNVVNGINGDAVIVKDGRYEQEKMYKYNPNATYI